MSILPVVQRQLSAAARRRRTYWLRTAFALLALGIGLVSYLSKRSAPAYEIAQILFEALKWLSFAYCLAYGIRSTADCLSAEKREGTLGLLFLTDLKGYDVVLGKLAACSLAGFYGLLSTLPVLALPLLFGGVTVSQFWRVLLMLLNTFLLSVALGIFVSAISRQARHAMLGTLVALLLFSATFPCCSALLSELVPGADWLASWLIPHRWQDRPTEGRGLPWRAQWQSWLYGGQSQRHCVRTHWLERNPVTWLATRRRFPSASVWCVLAVYLGLWEWGCRAAGHTWYNEGGLLPDDPPAQLAA
jgi:ABC-type transport system involved in multi-copper enzyme maturation permease subunit